MKKNKAGFTLIELLISVAILGILILAEVGFLSTGTNLYRSIFCNVNLQTDSQTTMNQIENYVANCSGGICFNSNTLYAIDKNGTDGTEYILKFDPSNHEIDYSQFTVNAGVKAGSPSQSGLMASRVTSFSVDLSTAMATVSFAKITVGFIEQGTSLSAQKAVLLRNSPIKENTEDDLIAALFH